MDCSMPGFPVLHYLLKFAHTHVHWVGDAIQQSHPLLPSSPALNLSQHQGLFQWVGPFHIRWPRYYSFRFSISPSSEYSGLISLSTDWFDCCQSESCSVMSNSLWPHELQHSRPSCPSPTPWLHPNSCPLSRWCHPTLSSSVVPFSSCPQSFPASGSFQMSRFFSNE